MSSVYPEGCFIKVPIFDSKLIFTYESESLLGEKRSAQIIPSCEKNYFYAYFIDHDVDFRIEFDNSECTKKNSACFSMEVLEKKHSFLLESKQKLVLNKLELNGKRLHFTRQKSEEEKTKTKKNATATTDSMNIHQIQFTVRYSRTYILYISMPEGEEEQIKMLTLIVVPTTTIKELKRRIEKHRKIPANIQNLHYQGKELFFDYQTIFQSGISNHHTINLTRDTTVPIKIKLIPTNKIITTSIYSRDSLQTLVENIKKEEGVVIKKNNLYLRGIPILDHDPNASFLDDLTIEDLKLNKNNSDVLLFAVISDVDFKNTAKKQKLMTVNEVKNKGASFPITIKNSNDSNKVFSINVSASDTVGQVKNKIQQSINIAIINQNLNFKNAHGSFLLQDNLTLELYGIKENSELKLNRICDEDCANSGGKLIVKDLTGCTVNFSNFCGCEVIERLKEFIQYELGVPPDEQKLIYNNKELQDDDQIFEYNIPDNSTIHLIRRLSAKSPFECNCQQRKCQMCCLNHTKHFNQRFGFASNRKADQIFSSAVGFVPDKSLTPIEPFIVEFRTYGE